MILSAILLTLLFWASSWLSPQHQPLREAQRLLSEGKPEAAVQTLGQALADNPDSPVVAYNLGNAQYRAKQYEAAVQAYRRVHPEKSGNALGAQAAYNSGNALFRIAEGLEQERPQDSLAKYAEALVEYRRALALAPGDADAKFNYEYTARKMDELRKRLEEMAKQQPTPESQNQSPSPTPAPEQSAESPPTPQSPAPESGNEPQDRAESAANDGADREPPNQSTEQREPEAAAAEPQDQNEAGSDAAGAGAEEPSAGDSSEGSATAEAAAAGASEPRDRKEARALIDTARQEELSPGEFWRQQQRGVVAEPLQDW
ncbi:MAG: hypothetical protein KatS3mg077_3183 [Candidatus Binatia bacterium]|nr:MAG: hypothetical protein KatS3mg077_3183 [Candidatus Binatia bacterium]